jgi:TP53 regulating kinase-like protein
MHLFYAVTPRRGAGDQMEAWSEQKLLHIGAEAAVSAGLFLGLPAVRKVRRPRGYRHPDLERRLTKSRMSAEARMLTRLAQTAMPVPILLSLDAERGEMILSLMAGEPVIECLRKDRDVVKNGDGATELSIAGGEESAQQILAATGRVIRCLHSRGAVHGDLTTNNLLWDDDVGISLIDFGLSSWTTEVEKMGLDLQVLHECLTASHPEHPEAMAWVLDGYQSADEDEKNGKARAAEWSGSDTPPPSAKEVLTRFDKIRSRVRYHG